MVALALQSGSLPVHPSTTWLPPQAVSNPAQTGSRESTYTGSCVAVTQIQEPAQLELRQGGDSSSKKIRKLKNMLQKYIPNHDFYMTPV